MSHSLVQELRSREEEFIRIGNLAPVLRLEVEGRRKLDSGDSAVDIVTDADIRLQEEYLKLFWDTPLTGCQLWAEESSPNLTKMAERFRGDNGLYLCLDPIDGTERYVENAPYYSSIVSLHDGTRPLYSWIYYPKMPWWARLDDQGLATSGPGWPEERLGAELAKTIVYTAGDPAIDCPDWKEKLEAQGYRFCKSREIGPYGAKYLLLRDKVGGYFVARPNPYDGLLAYHYTQAQKGQNGWELWSDLPPEGFTRLEQDKRGFHYPIRYLALHRKDS